MVNMEQRCLWKKHEHPFWNDFFSAHNELGKKYIPENSELLTEPLFWNENFKIGKKTFFFPDWINNNVLTVKALVKQDGTFKSLNEIIGEYNFNP